MRNHITLRLLQFSINYGYFLGGTPFHWNSKKLQIELIKNPTDLFRWVLAILLSISFSILFICGTVLGSLSTTDSGQNHDAGGNISIVGIIMGKNFTTRQNIVPIEHDAGGNNELVQVQRLLHLIVLVGCSASSLLHLNLVIKRKDIVITMNRCLRLMKRLDTFKLNPWNTGDIVLIICASSISLFTPLLSVNMYWSRSYFYIWLTHCTEYDNEFSIYFMQLMSNIIKIGVQWYFVTITCSVGLIYLVLTYPFLYFGSGHFRMLLFETNNNNQSPRDKLRLDNFVRNYRSFQLLMSCENSCLGAYTLPAHIIILTTACIVSLNALIKISMQFAQFAFFLALISGYVLHMITGIKEASLLPQLTKLLFRVYQEKRTCENEVSLGSMITKRYLNSFPPLTVGFGSFGRIDKNTYIWMLSNSVSFTISILLLKS